MLDDVVVVPVEMSNRDLMVILEIANKLGVNRNDAIRILLKKGFEYISQSPNEDLTETVQENKTKKKRGDKK